MKTVTQWFDEYAESHQNETNQSIHFICVPTIYFTIVAMLVSIPNDWLIQFLPAKLPIITNWAFVILIPVMLFYLRLSLRHFLEMASFSLVCLVVAVILKPFIPLFYISLAIFILAWAGQFYGHKVEGKKPSFFKDLQFLLIGPIWVFEKMLKKAVQ